MKIYRTIRLLLTFYRGFFFFNTCITLACCGLFLEYGYSIFRVLFWFKLATLAAAVVFINSYKQKEFYYYRNLGLTPLMLWACTLSFDFILYLFLLLTTHRLQT